MRRSTLRAFGIAFFLIGLFLTLTNSNPTFSEDFKEDEYKNKISQLEQQLIEANQSIAELEQNGKTIASEQEMTEDAKQPDADLADSKKETAVKDTLYIYSGLTSAEVAQKLKDMKIIDNSVEMELFLAQPEYATTIQKGQFELNSSMSIKEIADIITGKQK